MKKIYRQDQKKDLKTKHDDVSSINQKEKRMQDQYMKNRMIYQKTSANRSSIQKTPVDTYINLIMSDKRDDLENRRFDSFPVYNDNIKTDKDYNKLYDDVKDTSVTLQVLVRMPGN